MKKLIFAMIFISSIQVFAKGEQVVAEIAFKNSVRFHKYTLVKDASKPVFKVIFQENKKKPVAKLVSESQADYIKNETTRIIWNSEYRKPVNMQRCSEYVKLSSGSEKTNVCAENRKATGMAYGLLNAISQIF